MSPTLAMETARTPLDLFMLRHHEIDMKWLAKESGVSMSLLYYLRRGQRLGSIDAWERIVACLQRYARYPLSASDFVDVEAVKASERRVVADRRRTWFPDKAALRERDA